MRSETVTFLCFVCRQNFLIKSGGGEAKFSRRRKIGPSISPSHLFFGGVKNSLQRSFQSVSVRTFLACTIDEEKSW
jgi:hypothetical protein